LNYYLSKKKRALLASFIFMAVIYFPPVMHLRYTAALFLLWIPVFLRNERSLKLKYLVLIVVFLLSIINLVKSIWTPSFFRDGLIFAIYDPLVVIGAYFAGVDVLKSNWMLPKVIIGLSLILEGIICVIQILDKNIGILFATIYGSQRYINMYYTWSHPRAVGTFGNGNYLGFLIFCGILFFTSLHRNLKKTTLIIAITLLVISMMTTRSRAAIFLSLIFIMLLIFFKLIDKGRNKKNIILIPIVFIFIGIFLYLFLFIGPYTFAYISNYLGRPITFNSNSWNEIFSAGNRFATWQNANISFSDSNIADFIFGRVKETRVIVDNLYLEFFVRYGIIGSFLVFTILIAIVLNNKNYSSKNSSYRSYKWSVLVMFLISGVVADYWFNSMFSPLYFFLLEASLKAFDSVQ
jgi:hypothetical protein